MALILISIGILFFTHNGGGDNVSFNRAVDEDTSLTVVLEKDTDHDGLKDWEEVVWGTNYSLVDTDGDGMSDNEEIALERDPTSKDPGSFIKDSLLYQQENETASTTGSYTETVLRDLLEKYSILKSTGIYTDETSKYLVDTLSQKMDVRQVDVYNESDVKTTADLSDESIRKYVNNIGKMILQYSAKYPGDEMEIFGTAIELENSNMLESLSVYSSAYKKLAEDLLSTSVPSIFIKDHILLLNVLSGMGSSLEKMQFSLSDPLIGIMGVGQYLNQRLKFNSFKYNIGVVLSEKGIVFSINEPGRLFMQTNIN